MRSLTHYLVPALLAVLAAVAAGAADAANPEPLDLDADILAMLAKEKARAVQSARSSAALKQTKPGESTSTAECGAVNIGNVVGNGRIGFAPIDVNVIVVGDIVNANNKCK